MNEDNLAVKFFSNFGVVALLALAAQFISARAGAQSISLAATVSTNSIAVSNSLTYTISVTNTSVSLETITVTNTFSAPVQFISYSPSSITATNSTNTAVLFYGGLDIGLTAQMTLTVQPTTVGNLNNAIVVLSQTYTNVTAATNLATSVITTNIADLGVTLTGFPSAIYTNDWVTYETTVSNAGPAAATGVILTNSLPTNGWELLSSSPTNASYQTASNNFVFNLGTLAAGASTNLQFTVEPTNAGLFTFSGSVNSTNQSDPNTANNFFSTNVTVTNFLAGTANLIAYTNSAQSFNPYTGLEQQIVTLSNAGPATIASARVIVTGLTNQLYNAVGTNSGNPFVVYGASLTSGQAVNLTLQFYPDYTNFPFSQSQLQPVEIAQPDLSLPATGIASTNLTMVLVTNIAPGYWLVGFKAMTNHIYTIAYNDNLASTNWQAAQPSFPAPANYVLWIDYGPPETLSNSTSMRMYRVYLKQ